jgi:transposase
VPDEEGPPLQLHHIFPKARLSRNGYPSDVSNEEWAFLAPYLTLMREDAPQRHHSLRELFNGLRSIARTSLQWRFMPTDLPPWQAVYQQTRRWIDAGLFDSIVADLRELIRLGEGRAPQPTAMILDSRTSQSTPESGASAGWDGAKRRKGTKMHLAVDTLGQLLTLYVTPAHEQDRAQVKTLANAMQEATGETVTLFAVYMHFGLDLRQEDLFWNIADPGWAYGLYYGIVGPLMMGHPILLYHAPFSPASTFAMLEKYGITNFAAAPTVYRALRAEGVAPTFAARGSLRIASSAGEPLNPEVIAWARDQLGVPLHDQYGQTEHGMLVNNHHHPALRRPLKLGSMGHALPGYRVVIVDSAGSECASET